MLVGLVMLLFLGDHGLWSSAATCKYVENRCGGRHGVDIVAASKHVLFNTLAGWLGSYGHIARETLNDAL